MKTGFFDESPNAKSMTRLCSFILLLFFMAYNLPFAFANARAVIEGKATAAFDPNYLAFNIILLVAVFVPKVLQKIVEMKFGKMPDIKIDSPESTGA